jgi:LacI family transcriptional regulator
VSATIRDVARLAGVSAMTVSRVINDQPRVKDETRRRVEAAIAELGYVPNGLARGLVRRKTKTIGVIVPDVANPFFTLVVSGAEDVAWRAGYHVLLCNTQTDLERERGYVDDMLAFRVEGVLIAPVSDRSAPHLRTLGRNQLPFVLIDRSIAGFHADLVQGDSVAGARVLVNHLIGLGHRRIAMISEPGDVSTARDRVRGYREALAAAGIEFRPELVAESSAIDARIAGEATSRFLDLPEPPTAIFALNNIAAIGVAEAARERGLTIPDDLGLVCFDDIELASRLDPFLTVLAQPAETFGTIAMQLLLDRLDGHVSERGRTVVLPGELVVRASAGPPADRDQSGTAAGSTGLR